MPNDLNIDSNTLLAGIGRPHTHAVVIRILIVIDGRVQFNFDQRDFGLGFVIDTLQAGPSLPLRLHVELATREETIDDISRDRFEVRTGFRFDSPDFRIDDWDQIWIFADQPSLSESDGVDPEPLLGSEGRLGDREAKTLAEWMDRGGGLFATGDHNSLGALVCHRIPRVRTMRKWRRAEGTPSQSSQHQNRTLQGLESASEFDTTLQPLELVFTQSVTGWPFQLIAHPHPVLESNAGPINHFPDHMHEGELVPDAEVKLDRPLDIPGYTHPEYPMADPEAIARFVGANATNRWQPRPTIIAYGHTTNRLYNNPWEPRLLDMGRLGSRRFGTVSVYDGEPARVGRVVCDSTWHHWFSYNLSSLVNGNPPAFRMMQAYYRNVAMWLAKRSQRQGLLTAAVWNLLVQGPPMQFIADQTVWEMGEQAIDLMTPAFGAAWITELISAHYDARPMHQVSALTAAGKDPAWSRLPEGLVNRAVLGSLAKALFPMAQRLRLTRTSEKGITVDTAAVERIASEGIRHVPSLLKESMTAAIASMKSMRVQLGEAIPPHPQRDTRNP